MNSEPLKKLIDERGFDQYQIGLEARLKAYKLDYELSYGDISNKSSLSVGLESDAQVAKMTVWISGECEMVVLEKTSGEIVLCETHHFTSEEDFFETWPKLVVFMREACVN